MTEKRAAEAGRQRLASALIDKGALRRAWLPAYDAVPRHLFVPEAIWPKRAGQNRQEDRVLRSEEPDAWWEAVYRDAPITTQWDDGAYDGPNKGRTPTCSSSMPTMVFSMLDALDVRDGHRVLEVGTGTGWNAALLAERLGSAQVVTVEVDERTSAEAASRLRAAGYRPRTVVADGAAGHPEGAPYDRVIATCSIGHVPRPWLAQTAPGGVIVAPWGPVYGGEAVVRLTVGEDGTASGPFVASSAFMRLREQRRNLPPRSAYLGEREWPADSTPTTTTLSPDDVGDWIHMFAIGAQVPDLFCRVERLEGAGYRLWLHDLGAASWATADYQHLRNDYRVRQSGPRKLWDELEASWRWWQDQGRPGFDRFGLTFSADASHTVWLDAPTHPVPLRAA